MTIFGFCKNIKIQKSPFPKSGEMGDLEEKEESGDTQNIQYPQYPQFPKNYFTKSFAEV